MPVQADAAVLREDRQQQGHPGRVEARGGPPGTLGGAGVTSACTSASRGRRPSMVTATQVPGPAADGSRRRGPWGRSRRRCLRRTGRRADLVGGPKRFFRARNSRNRDAVALEVEHHVDEVLEHPRARDRAVLGDVADDDGGDVAGLGDPDQRGGTSLTWVTPPGTPSTPRAPMVWIESTTSSAGWACSMWVSTARGRSRRRGRARRGAAGAVGAQPHLGGGLLAGDVEDAALVAEVWELPGAGACSCRCLARRRGGSPSRGPARRRAPGRARAPRRSGRSPWCPSTWPIGIAGAGSPVRRAAGRRSAPPSRPPTPRPGTPRSGRPTWQPPTRTRSSGSSPGHGPCRGRA